MFDIGFSELVLIAVLGLIILGPERLPAAAKTLGSWIRKARSLANNFSSEIEKELEIESLRDELANQNEKIMKQAEALSKKLNRPVEDIYSLDENENSHTRDDKNTETDSKQVENKNHDG